MYAVGVFHHYIYIISQLRLTSQLKSTVVLLYTGTPGASSKIYNENTSGETETRNPWITKPVFKPLSYTAQFAIAGKEWNLSNWITKPVL